MKFLKYLPCALALTALVGCSNDELIDNVTTPDIMEDGGSVVVRLHLPSVSSKTRALFDEDPLQNGLESEFAVDNGTIVLFDAYKNVIVKQVFTGGELNFGDNDANNITSTSATVTIPENVTTPKYVLALLNITPQTAIALNAASTYSDFQRVITEESAITVKNGTGYFFMSNSVFDNTGNTQGAPYRDKDNDGLQDLQEIDPASIGQSKNATVTTATQIYVERASAKINVSFPMNNQEGLFKGSVTKDDDTNLPTITFSHGDEVEITGWTLTVTNKSYYPVKNISAANWTDWRDGKVYQMATHVSRGADYRSYFAVDPNYSLAANAADLAGFYTEFNYATYDQAISTSAADVYEYCLENTFDVGGQMQNQTTAVLVAAVYTPVGGTTGDNVYTVNGNAYTPAGLLAHIVDKLNTLNYKNGDAALTVDNFDFATSKFIFKDLIVYKGDNDMKLGTETVVTVSADLETIKTQMNAVLTTVLGDRALAYYIGGKCFYSIPVKHFGDSEVRLYDNATNDSYIWNGTKVGINSADQLGSYGMLRNNWYSVSVNSISQIGRPIPVDPTTPINPDPSFPDPLDPIPGVDPTPDDTESFYINAQINILPWARRSQDADL